MTTEPTTPRTSIGDSPGDKTYEATGRRGLFWVSSIGLLVVLIDQFTKWLALQSLQGQPPVEVFGEYVKLTFVRNPGAAFSIGTEYTWIFSIAAVAVAVAVLFAARKISSGWWLLALGLLIGGAVGNLVDRVAQPPGGGQGHVIDFLQLPNWPVFNVADMAVVGAAILMVALTLFGIEPNPSDDDAAEETDNSDA